MSETWRDGEGQLFDLRTRCPLELEPEPILSPGGPRLEGQQGGTTSQRPSWRIARERLPKWCQDSKSSSTHLQRGFL